MHRESKAQTLKEAQYSAIVQFDPLPYQLLDENEIALVLDDLQQKSFNDVLQDLSSQTNRTFAHSFLYPKQEELYQRLDIPDKFLPNNRIMSS
jgi:hypothetical protein